MYLIFSLLSTCKKKKNQKCNDSFHENTRYYNCSFYYSFYITKIVKNEFDLGFVLKCLRFDYDF